MATHLASAMQSGHTEIRDLAALFCRGGLVVQTLGEPGTVSVQSTIQLDGDITVCISRPALCKPSVLLSHVAQVEARIRKATRLFRGTMWTAHGALAIMVSTAWLLGLLEGPPIDANLSTVTIWIVCSIGSTAIVELLLQTPILRRSLLSSIVNGLSRIEN